MKKNIYSCDDCKKDIDPSKDGDYSNNKMVTLSMEGDTSCTTLKITAQKGSSTGFMKSDDTLHFCNSYCLSQYVSQIEKEVSALHDETKKSDNEEA